MAKLALPTLLKRFVAQQDAVAKLDNAVRRAEAARDKEKLKLEKIGNEIQDRFTNEQIQGHTTKDGIRAELKPLKSPSLFDWNKLTKYVKSKNAFELFQRRINKSAWLEHLDSRKGRPVPGVKSFDRYTLSVTRVKKPKAKR